MPLRKKLAGQWEIEKSKPNLTEWHKILIHLAYNIQAGKGTNEDIEEIKEEAEQASEDEFKNDQDEVISSALLRTEGINSGLNHVKAEKNEEHDQIQEARIFEEEDGNRNGIQQPIINSGLGNLDDIDKQSLALS